MTMATKRSAEASPPPPTTATTAGLPVLAAFASASCRCSDGNDDTTTALPANYLQNLITGGFDHSNCNTNCISRICQIRRLLTCGASPRSCVTILEHSASDNSASVMEPQNLPGVWVVVCRKSQTSPSTSNDKWPRSWSRLFSRSCQPARPLLGRGFAEVLPPGLANSEPCTGAPKTPK